MRYTPAVADRPPFPFRVLQRGLKAASRAGSAVIDHMLQSRISDRGDLGEAGLKKTVREKSLHAATSVVFLTEAGRKEVSAVPGATVLAAAQSGDVEIRYYCGGNCSCGTCRIEIVEGAKNLSPLHANEEVTLGMEAKQRGDRLACQASVLGPVTVRIPEWF